MTKKQLPAVIILLQLARTAQVQENEQSEWIVDHSRGTSFILGDDRHFPSYGHLRRRRRRRPSVRPSIHPSLFLLSSLFL